MECSKLLKSDTFLGDLLLQVRGTDYKTADGTCIRDYIDVTDLVDAHVRALEKAKPGEVGIYNVGTGKGNLSHLHNGALCLVTILELV